MKQVIIFGLILALAGCGGVHRFEGGRTTTARQPSRPVEMATGPINSACLSSDREARSRELCGCVQAVANRTLSAAQQRVAVTFYADPHSAQEIRQSDRASHERFWEAYKVYGEEAEKTCA